MKVSPVGIRLRCSNLNLRLKLSTVRDVCRNIFLCLWATCSYFLRQGGEIHFRISSRTKPFLKSNPCSCVPIFFDLADLFCTFLMHLFLFMVRTKHGDNGLVAGQQWRPFSDENALWKQYPCCDFWTNSSYSMSHRTIHRFKIVLFCCEDWLCGGFFWRKIFFKEIHLHWWKVR